MIWIVVLIGPLGVIFCRLGVSFWLVSSELDALLDLCVSGYDVLAREAAAEVSSHWSIMLVARLIKRIKMDDGRNVVLAYTDKQENVLAMQTNIRRTLTCLQDSGAIVWLFVSCFLTAKSVGLALINDASHSSQLKLMIVWQRQVEVSRIFKKKAIACHGRTSLSRFQG